MEQEGYIRVNVESNRIYVRLAKEFASCCGVNLAFAGLGLWFFFRELRSHALVQGSVSLGSDVYFEMEFGGSEP